MCGIVGYAGGNDKNIVDDSDRALVVALNGLTRLEYRGYDSAGIALCTRPSNILDDDSASKSYLQVRKKAGRLKNLIDEIETHPLLPAQTSIGHTRWATHGEPTDFNAHPHISNDLRVALIHNGIIENASKLRQALEERGVHFTSVTDTEVVVHLLREELRFVEDDDNLRKKTKYPLTHAMQRVVKQLNGTFTLLAVDASFSDVIVGAKHDSPLVVGLGDGENFFGSDVVAFIEYTSNAIEIQQDQIVTLTSNDVVITDFDGNLSTGKHFTVDWDVSAATKSGYKTFMEKEIREEPKAVADTLLGRFDETTGCIKLDKVPHDVNAFEERLRTINKVIIVACGTAAYAGLVARYAIEHWCRIPVEVELAHEFRYRDPIVNSETLVVSISQSGETMDTLMAQRYASEQGAQTISICNTKGASIVREADGVLYTRAGLEVSVASTKAFVSQITAAYLLGLYLASIRGNKYTDEVLEIVDDLCEVPDKIQELVDQFESISNLAHGLRDIKSVLFLGRNIGYPVALEGALKLKELAYIHAEGFAAGELKHGPIALIDANMPVFVILPSLSRPQLHAKVISNIQEIKARGAQVFTIADAQDIQAHEHATFTIDRPIVPSLLTPLLDIVPLQIFAYALATSKGLDVDKPRNLAKSVTVE
ncbi:MAG: glutamine--fructose-6-phosphate transaminase (isomerizing) [Candidatus Ancillula sp.]|nr:glutamine--fructose-6-phosphate transaminase (isomerizing) [Candidatus Ancillula sp.]